MVLGGADLLQKNAAHPWKHRPHQSAGTSIVSRPPPSLHSFPIHAPYSPYSLPASIYDTASLQRYRSFLAYATRVISRWAQPDHGAAAPELLLGSYRTGWELNPGPLGLESNVLTAEPTSHLKTRVQLFADASPAMDDRIVGCGIISCHCAKALLAMSPSVSCKN